MGRERVGIPDRGSVFPTASELKAAQCGERREVPSGRSRAREAPGGNGEVGGHGPKLLPLFSVAPLSPPKPGGWTKPEKGD